MKKFNMLIQMGSVFFVIVSVVLFGFTYTDISKVGHTGFDLTKWLDADIYVLKLGWHSLILGAVLNVASFILNIKNHQTLMNADGSTNS